MIEYKVIKLRQASHEESVTKELNELAEEGWKVVWFGCTVNGGWIILDRLVYLDDKLQKEVKNGND
jgi:hypothetical protein